MGGGCDGVDDADESPVRVIAMMGEVVEKRSPLGVAVDVGRGICCRRSEQTGVKAAMTRSHADPL
jgi:hypothetical protein